MYGHHMLCSQLLFKSHQSAELLVYDHQHYLPKPAPTRALDSNGGRAQSVLELGQGAELSINQLSQLTRRRLTTTSLGWGQILPENGVVDVTTAIEFDGIQLGDHSRVVTLGL